MLGILGRDIVDHYAVHQHTLGIRGIGLGLRGFGLGLLRGLILIGLGFRLGLVVIGLGLVGKYLGLVGIGLGRLHIVKQLYRH